jgi:REP element-mobilizing transposase RayT
LADEARALGCPWTVVGGVEDHVHLLCAMPATVAVADLMRHLKGWTARAVNMRRPDSLRWQGGYGAFSVSPADLAHVEAYVRNQPDHHRTADLRDAWE